MAKNIIAFIDLLATKESAKFEDELFYNHLQKFHQIIIDKYEEYLIGSESKIHIFSDCAYIELSNSKNGFNFLRSVRSELFGQNLYFKCSLSLGSLGIENQVTPFTSYGKLSSEKKKSTLPERIQPLKTRSEEIERNISVSLFNKESVELYILHEKFKGIGFILGKFKNEFPRGDLCQSVYVDSNGELVEYYDITLPKTYIGSTFKNKAHIKYEEDILTKQFEDQQISQSEYDDKLESIRDQNTECDLANKLLSKYLLNMLKAINSNAEYSRYYVPFLVSLINSSNFDDLNVFNNDWSNHPVVFEVLICKLFLEKGSFSGLKHRDIIYLSIFNKLFEYIRKKHLKGSDSYNALMMLSAKFILKRKWLQNAMRANKTSLVFTNEARRDFSECLAIHQHVEMEKNS